MQRALNIHGAGLVVDGIVGPKTRQELQDQLAATGEAVFLIALQEKRQAFYRSCKQFPVFGKGWLNRCDDAFSVARANNIARTEIAEAQEEGSMVYYRASGVVDRKKWSTAHGGDMCPRCIGAEAEGAIPLEATFESTGTVHAPGHQHCRCRTIPVLKEETP